MVMDAINSGVGSAAEAIGLIKPKKAKLVVVGPPFPEGTPPHEIECMFNPTKYSLNQSVVVSGNVTPVTPGGSPQYGGASPMTLAMTLFFDDYASAKGDVTPKITTLLNWTKPIKDHDRAPLVRFVWGGNPQLENFKGFLTRVNVSYTVFRRDGRPVQAEVEIAIEGLPDPLPIPPNPTSHAAHSSRTHTTIEGDTLQSVAYSELGKPTYWRGIAELNGIDDPLRLAPGTVLLIPSVADAARGA